MLLTADDYGLHPAVNRGIERLARRGRLWGVSVMVHAGATLDGVEALRGSGVRCGLHLVFVEERPLCPAAGLAGLLDGGGRLPRSHRELAVILAKAPWKTRALAEEARAQLRRHRGLGLPLDFINSHQHVHLIPPIWLALRPLLRELRGVAVRCGHTLPLSPSPDGAVAASSRLSWALAPLPDRELLAPHGITHAGRMTCGVARAILAAAAPSPGVRPELVLHPGDEDDDLRRRYGRWGYDWRGEAVVAERIGAELLGGGPAGSGLAGSGLAGSAGGPRGGGGA